MHRSTPELVQQDQALTERITRAHGVMTAAMADLLAAVAEAERDESYWAQGSQTAPEWLAANLRIHSRTARTWARVAKKLPDYPLFGKLMAAGQLGFDQIKEVLRFIEPEDQDLVAEDVVASTAEELESNARSVRRLTLRQVEQTSKERWFEGFFDHDELKYHFRGSIPGQDGLVVDTAMRLLAWNNPEEPLSDLPKDPNLALADAFVEMASSALAEQPNHDTATVVVHADASLLALADRVGAAEHGPDVPMEAIRRMTCDGRLQLVAHAEDGSVVGVGRITRTIPPWLRRLVRQRDEGCRFPGCGRTYWTHVHHMVHWAHGGATDLENLVTLCGHHHRMLHEQGWTVTGEQSGRVVWRMRGGTPFEREPGRRPFEDYRDFDVAGLRSRAAELLGTARPSPA